MAIKDRLGGIPPRDGEVPLRFTQSARERCVRVKNKLARPKFGERGEVDGSGVIVETGLVFTNFHLVEDEGGITVNDHPAELVHMDIKFDLAALRVSTRRLNPIRISRERASYNQPVFYVGNPEGYNKAVVTGRINREGNKEIVADTTPSPGFSGSGLYDAKNGMLIGLIDTLALFGHHPTFTIAIPAKVLLPFLEEAKYFLRKK